MKLPSLKTCIITPLTQTLAKNTWVKPASWPDISKTDAGSIRILACDIEPIICFFVSQDDVVYDIFIDGALHKTVSGAEITRINLRQHKGTPIDYPAPCNAFVIELKPKSGSLAAFKLRLVENQDRQSLLWVDYGFNRINAVKVFCGEWVSPTYRTPYMEAITAPGNMLSADEYGRFVYEAPLKTMPALADASGVYAFDCPIYGANIKGLHIDGLKDSVRYFSLLDNCKQLEAVKLTRCDFSNVKIFSATHRNNYALRELPRYNFKKVENMQNFLTNAKSLRPTYLDLSACNNLQIIGCYGSPQMPMHGFKSLKVSSVAPFTGTAPQINVSYTGMDRQNLINLFESLPSVSQGQTINITGAEGANSLLADDINIALSKGWIVMR